MNIRKVKLLAFIGGSNMSTVFPADEDPLRIGTPFGPTSAPIERHEVLDKKFLFLPRHGRNHGTKAHRVNYRANIWALRDLGVDNVIAGATVGSVDPSLSNGDFVVPDQVIDYTYSREVSFEQEGIEEHYDFTDPFNDGIRGLLLKASVEADVEARDGGTYGCAQGPRLETKAEIGRMANDGCTLVGMTLMPEASLARQVGLDYGAFCLVVNPAAGVSGTVSLEDTAAVSRKQDANLRRFIESIVALID